MGNDGKKKRVNRTQQRARRKKQAENLDEQCKQMRDHGIQMMESSLMFLFIAVFFLLWGNVPYGFLLYFATAGLNGLANWNLVQSVYKKYGPLQRPESMAKWLELYDGPLFYSGEDATLPEKPAGLLTKERFLWYYKQNMLLMTPRRVFGCTHLGMALFMGVVVHKAIGVEDIQLVVGLLALGLVNLSMGAGDLACHWFRRHFGGATKARFFGPVLLIGALSLSFAVPGPLYHTICMTVWVVSTFVFFNKKQRAWVIPLYSLVKLLMLGLNVETSALLLVSAFFMLLNHGHIKTRGKAVDGLTEGDVAISWALALPIPFIHMFPPVLDWYQMGWEWGLHHIHAPHFHVDIAVAAAILGVLSYATIARDALYACLMSGAQILLRRGWKPSTVTGVIFFFSALLGAIAGEAAGAAIVCMFVTPLLIFGKENSKYIYTVTFWCAIALSLSAGIVPIAAPPVAVIWAKMGLMGWKVIHLFMFTGIICILGKAFCAWRITKHIKHVQLDPDFVMGWRKPLGMSWTHFTTCAGFLVLIIVHVFLSAALGQYVWVLYALDGFLCAYIIFKLKPKKERIEEPNSIWAFEKRFVPLTVTMLVAAFEIIGHDGSMSALAVANTRVFLWAMTITAVMIPVVHSFSFSLSAVSDNAMITSALIPIALQRIKHHLPISNLTREYVQGLPVAEQVLILTTAIFTGTVILSSLWAGVASIGANALPNSKLAKEWELENETWIKLAAWYTAGCYVVGLISCYILWAAMYLYYVHPW